MPAHAAAFHERGGEGLVGGFDHAGADREFLGPEFGVAYPDPVLHEVVQNPPDDLAGARFLRPPRIVAQRADDLPDPVGFVAQRLAPGLEPACFGNWVRSVGEMLAGMPEVEGAGVGVEPLQECPVVDRAVGYGRDPDIRSRTCATVVASCPLRVALPLSGMRP